MRKLLLFVAVLLFATPAFSQIGPLPPAKKASDYQKHLTELQTWGKNLSNDEFYEEHFKFKNKKTDVDQKFFEFSAFDRRMFQISTTDKFNKYLDKLQETWQDEMKSAKDEPPDKKATFAGADDIAKSITNLVKLRKEVVKSWEDQSISIFKDYPKEFETIDKVLYLKNIKTIKDSLEKK